MTKKLKSCYTVNYLHRDPKMTYHHTKHTVEHYSSGSSSSSDSAETVSELASTQVYKKAGVEPDSDKSSNTAQISSSQTNVALFQTVNSQNNPTVVQAKEKENCCDCFLSLFMKK